MINYNFHSHTERCGHAQGSDEEYVKAAIDNHFTHLGFSDHAPFPGVHQPHTRMDYEQFPEYIQSVQDLKEKYHDQIHIYLGLECENFLEHRKTLEQYKEQCDYLLLGQHSNTPGGKSFFNIESDEDIKEYADLVVNGIESGLFDAVAHPDVYMYSQSSWNLACQQAAERICVAATKHKVALEVNLNGIRYGKTQYVDGERYAYPHRNFWEIASQAGATCIYGLDAHQPSKYEITGQEIINEILDGIPLSCIQKL